MRELGQPFFRLFGGVAAADQPLGAYDLARAAQRAWEWLESAPLPRVAATLGAWLGPGWTIEALREWNDRDAAAQAERAGSGAARRAALAAARAAARGPRPAATRAISAAAECGWPDVAQPGAGLPGRTP